MRFDRRPEQIAPIDPPDGRIEVHGPDGTRRLGHAHFWERALSRRQFVRSTAGATALAITAGVAVPGVALAGGRSQVAPRPIPGGLQPGGPDTEVFHLFLPGAGNEPSTITDFAGVVGIAQIQGTGTGTSSGGSEELLFDIDVRFMKGLYIGVDDRPHQGTFGFV